MSSDDQNQSVPPPDQAGDQLPGLTSGVLPLPGGFAWTILAQPHQPELKRYAQLLSRRGATAATWGALWAAYDGGWTVVDRRGRPLPSPRYLSERQYARVLREAPGVVEAIADWTRLLVVAVLSPDSLQPAPADPAQRDDVAAGGEPDPVASAWGLAGDPDPEWLASPIDGEGAA